MGSNKPITRGGISIDIPQKLIMACSKTSVEKIQVMFLFFLVIFIPYNYLLSTSPYIYSYMEGYIKIASPIDVLHPLIIFESDLL